VAGPRYFSIWGIPKRQTLRTVGDEEYTAIAARTESLYVKIFLESPPPQVTREVSRLAVTEGL